MCNFSKQDLLITVLKTPVSHKVKIYLPFIVV